jgi:hypothetical protein
MSLIKSALALVTGAAAQDLSPWDIKERTAYVVMMDGAMKTVRLGDKGTAMLMKTAKKVPHGTVFIMSGKDLYMVNDATMFDRAGMPVFGGS